MFTPQETKVLAVDDESMLLGIMETTLKEQGYQVAVAANGQEALRQVREYSPDVILLDVIMPDISGFELARKLKTDPTTSAICIIMVTGLGSIEDRVKGLEAGADDFLSKPFNLDELVVRVRSLARLKHLQDEMRRTDKLCSEAGCRLQRKRPEILIVEDDERIISICKNVLEATGYDLISANDDEQALGLIRRQGPDLIILDIMLPGRDGLDLLSQIRKEPAGARVPVIILTALGDLKTKIKGFYIGADDYLVKPVSSMELLARVRANLRKYECERELARQLDEVFLQATTDHLTGLNNRRYLDSVLKRELARFQRNGQGLAVLIMDIDNFKQVNDRYGHNEGDKLLQYLAGILKDNLRAGDLSGRWGGDEFLAVLPDISPEEVETVARRIENMFSEYKLPPLKQPPEPAAVPTLSIGIAFLKQEQETGELIEEADQALYRAKSEGRHSIVFGERP